MKRRAFVAGMATVMAAPRCGYGQSMPRVGLISSVAPLAELKRNLYFGVFTERLEELGWREGTNVVVERRTTEGRSERFDAVIAELLDQRVDVLVVVSQAGAVTARKWTRDTPIVMVTGAQPVEAGLAASLARPGGNVTGHTFTHDPREEGKRLQLISEVLRHSVTVACVAPRWAWTGEYGENARNAARTLGMPLTFVPGDSDADFRAVPDLIRRDAARGLYAFASAENFAFRAKLLDAIRAMRLPAMFAHRELAEAGALMSYGASLRELWRGAAGYVDKILRGAKPADLPIERPAKFELVLNLKTAKTLGLTIPPSLLLRADHVIE